MNFISKIFTRARPRPRDFIGPPHSVSNIRPILVRDLSPYQRGKTHPYSLNEFGDEDDADLQWRIEQERLNAFNHAFWLDSNTRFLQGKQQVLAQFHDADKTSPKDKEDALSEFYARWSIQEATRQADYTAEWNTRNRALIRLGMRRQLRIWRDFFTIRPS